MSGAGDLSRNRQLSEASLLSSLENRYKDELTESYVGNVLLRVSHPVVSSSQFLPLFCSSIIEGVAQVLQDQCMLVYGTQSVGKRQLVMDALSDLLLHLDDPYGHTSSITSVVELLNFLSSSFEDCQSRCFAMTTLLVDPATNTLKGALYSLALLDTSELHRMMVFRENGIQLVSGVLQKLGLSSCLVGEVGLLLKVVAALIAGRDVVEAMAGLGVNVSPHLNTHKLSQLLYSYLVHWIVKWLNSLCVGSTGRRVTWMSLLSSPGHHRDVEKEEKEVKGGQLASLTLTCLDQWLLHAYHSRQFVWEQEQYLEEGLDWEVIEVDSNSVLVDTLYQEGGLLDVLAGDDYGAVCAGVRCVCSEGDASFLLDGSEDVFTLVHTTGEREYVLEEVWLEANQVHMTADELRVQFQSSSCSLLVQMAENMGVSPDHVVGSECVARCCLTQRTKLVTDAISDIVTSSCPHFILSLEPNKEEGRQEFGAAVMLTQLQELKVLDTALMQSGGYPVRPAYNQFLRSYQVLLSSQQPLQEQLSPRDRCERILQEAGLKDYTLGQSSVMLKPWHPAELESAVELFQWSAKKLQHAFRRSLLRKKRNVSAPSLTQTTPTEENRSSRFNYGKQTTPPTPPPRPSYRSQTYLSTLQECSQLTLSSGLVPQSSSGLVPQPSSGLVPPPQPSSGLAPQSSSGLVHQPSSGLVPLASTFQANSEPLPLNLEPRSPTKEPRPRSVSPIFRKKESWKSSLRRKVPEVSPSPPSSELTSQPWFCSSISREKADECLKSQRSGTFMVRQSQKRVGEYSLSVSHDGTVKHFRVDSRRESRQRYQLYGARRSFSSLVALVDYYSQMSISVRGEVLSHPYCMETDGKPMRRKLGSIRQRTVESCSSDTDRGGRLGYQQKSKSCDFSLNMDPLVALQKQVEVEERIVEAARRMAELPNGTRKERQKRKQYLQMAQSKLMSVRQKYHLQKQRHLFIEYSMHPVLELHEETTILQ